MNILMSSSAGGNALMPIIWIVILFAFMYFFMIRPQQKETKEIPFLPQVVFMVLSSTSQRIL